MEAGSAGGVEDKAATAAEEEELTRWAAATEEVSSADIGAPLVEDAADESSSEETGAVDPPATGTGRVLRWATSGKLVRTVKAGRRPKSPEESAHQTRAAAAKKVVKTATVRKKASASSPPRRTQTPPSSPPPADADAGVTFDYGSLSPRRKMKAAEEEADDA